MGKLEGQGSFNSAMTRKPMGFAHAGKSGVADDRGKLACDACGDFFQSCMVLGVLRDIEWNAITFHSFIKGV